MKTHNQTTTTNDEKKQNEKMNEKNRKICVE